MASGTMSFWTDETKVGVFVCSTAPCLEKTNTVTRGRTDSRADCESQIRVLYSHNTRCSIYKWGERVSRGSKVHRKVKRGLHSCTQLLALVPFAPHGGCSSMHTSQANPRTGLRGLGLYAKTRY